MDDHGPVGSGASQPHHVSAENGEEYIVKGPSLTPAHPTVAANEWVAAGIAEKLGLPILPHQALRMGGDLLFGSLWMAGSTWSPGVDRAAYRQCENKDRVYDMVVFDTWLINRDRHHENLIVRHSSSGRRTLILNDHSHLLVSPSGPTGMGDLMACLDDLPGAFVRLAFIKDSIASPTRLSESLDGVEALSDGDIRAIVATTPPEFLAAKDRDTYAEFLVQRRGRLRDLFNRDLHSFPKLKGRPV